MKRLIVCVHDVTPRHATRLREIHAFLADHGVGSRYSMLVVPDFHDAWPLSRSPSFVRWLRERIDAGVEPLLHGRSHLDACRHAPGLTSWKARHLTAGEGEFSGLSEKEATDRIGESRRDLESLLGVPLSGFVAPAWLYSAGTKRALCELGFRVAEDHFRVWAPDTGTVLASGPVVSYASRDPLRVAGSLAWSRAAGLLLRPLDVLRIAIHPHDFDRPVLVEELGRAIDGAARRRRLARYGELRGEE